MTALECIKYVQSHMQIKFATQSGPYLAAVNRGKPTGCVNHSLGVAQPSVDKVFEAMNKLSSGYGVHAILGDFDKGDGRIIVTLPFSYRCWGCGSGSKGSYNSSRIQWEVCEPAGHTYTNGANMSGYNVQKNQQYFDRMWKMLVCWNVYCLKLYGYGVDDICDHSEAHRDGYASNHADLTHWISKHGKTMNDLRKEVSEILNQKSKSSETVVATEFLNMTNADVVMKIGPMCTANQRKTGILASVTAAQFILESGYGRTELAQKANNCFGMKCTLSDNNWKDSTWDGISKCVINTKEYVNGQMITISDSFRKYKSVQESIDDHAAYLLNARNGNKLRYDKLKGCTNAKTAVNIIKNGGYATDPNYVSKLLSIISKWNLKQYDADTADKNIESDKKGSDITTPFSVKVEIGTLRIRKGPGTDYSAYPYYTGVGVFTIVDTATGVGSEKGWGLLKSYESGYNGWVALDYCEIIE